MASKDSQLKKINNQNFIGLNSLTQSTISGQLNFKHENTVKYNEEIVSLSLKIFLILQTYSYN